MSTANATPSFKSRPRSGKSLIAKNKEAVMNDAQALPPGAWHFLPDPDSDFFRHHRWVMRNVVMIS